MEYQDEGKAAVTVLIALHAALRRGNLDISSDDPISLALWMGSSQLLQQFMESRKTPEAQP